MTDITRLSRSTNCAKKGKKMPLGLARGRKCFVTARHKAGFASGKCALGVGKVWERVPAIFPDIPYRVQVRAVTGRGGSRQERCSERVRAGVIPSAHNSRCDKKSAHASPHGSWQCIICARLSHGRCSTASSGAHLQQIQPFICRAMRVFCSSVNLLTRCEQQGPLLDSLRWTVRSAALPLLPAPPTPALGARCLTAPRMGS